MAAEHRMTLAAQTLEKTAPDARAVLEKAKAPSAGRHPCRKELVGVAPSALRHPSASL